MRLTVALGFVCLVGCTSNVKGLNDLGSGGNANPMCGDGVVDATEDCDDGAANGTDGDRCTAACLFSCHTDANCDDGKPCNGAETCVDHACVAGTGLADGASCGTDQVCEQGMCIDSRCGDGMITGTEECDDGNVTDGDGCNSDCKFSCVSTDSTRNCTPTDACMGQGACDDAKHTCSAGTPLGDGATCGSGNDYCKMGVCTMPMCGNGTLEPGEDCDDGGLNGTKGDSCTAMCKFACVNPATDCGAPPACEKFQCATHVCQAIADTTQNGMSCGAGGSGFVCKDGACASPTAVCGNGVVETGEDCDFGAQNGPNSGCEAVTCKFSCANAAACDDGNACNGTETCDAVTATNGGMGKKCDPGTAESDGTACATGKICKTKVCQNSTCGDGVVDPRSENCDPPGSMSGGKTCDSHCHYIVCGDGVREDTEQCDDGATSNLDGCDSSCKFEQDQRANSLDMSYDTATCNPNALGLAIGSAGRSSISMGLATAVKAGTIDIMMKLVGLDDLTGTSTMNPFKLGFLNATAVTGTGYDGTSDLDWWYTTDPMSIDSSRNPLTSLSNAKFVSSVLTADPGTLVLKVVLGGSAATLTMYQATFTAHTGMTTEAPKMSSGGATPGHLAGEHLDPALKSFDTLTGGQLCGRITARSLSQVTMPTALQGSFTCLGAGYDASNFLLDAIVNGCSTVLGTAVNKTQPDGSTDGKTYKFTLTGNKVTGCTGGAAYPDCLDKATYSSAFIFTTDRVIAK